MPKVVIDSHIEGFYAMFMTKKRFKCDNSPIFVEVGRHALTYEKFFNSFKAHGFMDKETMCVYSQIFNDRAKYDAQFKPFFLKKFMFSPNITEKLMEDPNAFDKNYVLAELQIILNSDFDIPTMDILHFPTVVSNQWVLMCVNPLFDTINFFDPTSTSTKGIQDELMNNLLFNFNTVCKELHLFGKDIGKFKKSTPTNYPSNAPLPDGGIYVMLYSDNWTGKFMREFSKEIVPKYRMLKSYDILYCIQNQIPPESFEKRIKKKVLQQEEDGAQSEQQWGSGYNTGASGGACKANSSTCGGRQVSLKRSRRT